MTFRDFFHHPHTKTALNMAFVFMFGFAAATIYLTRTNNISIRGTIKTSENGTIVLKGTSIKTDIDLGPNPENWYVVIDGVALTIRMRKTPFETLEDIM